MSKKQAVKDGPRVYHLENDCTAIAIAIKHPYVYYFDRFGILTSEICYNLTPYSLKNVHLQGWRTPKLIYNFAVGTITSRKVLKKAADRMREGDSVEKYIKYVVEESVTHKKNKELGRFIKSISDPKIMTKKSSDGSEVFKGATMIIYFHTEGKKNPILFFSTHVDDIMKIARKKLASHEDFGRFNLDVETLSCDVSYGGDHIFVKFKLA